VKPERMPRSWSLRAREVSCAGNGARGGGMFG
jgi:hypothetical protein